MDKTQAYMVWFDADKKAPLEARMARGLVRYKETRQQVPTVCFVSEEQMPELAGSKMVLVLPSRLVALNTFYIGVFNGNQDPLGADSSDRPEQSEWDASTGDD